MEYQEVQPGTIFTYKTPGLIGQEDHIHICRVLFVGEKHVFYDAYWSGIEKWTFERPLKNCVFYRLPLNFFERVTFSGFQAIPENIYKSLFADLPEVLFNLRLSDFLSLNFDDSDLTSFPDSIVYFPTGPQKGWLKPLTIELKGKSKKYLAEQIIEHQKFKLNEEDQIVIDRAGLKRGLPSYSLK